MSFVFFTLMVQAQFSDYVIFHYGSFLLLVPSLAYFVGSVIQRQKLVIVFLRKRRRNSVN
jgi:hypothetical protein